MKLGGTTITHNAIEYDYNFEEVLACLLEVCDEVAVVDGESRDGTWERLLAMQRRCPRLKLAQTPWATPSGAIVEKQRFDWLDSICEQAKDMLSTPMHLFLCADEVVDKADYESIRWHTNRRHTVACKRYTFWGGQADLYLPDEAPVRLGPTQLKCVGAAGELQHRGSVVDSPQVSIYHYGFLRHPAPLAAKQRKLQMANHEQYDPIFDAVEREGARALVDASYPTAIPKERLLHFTGQHPAIMHRWLRAHGYTL